MKLRPTIIEQIYNELNLGHFCQNDFLIEFNANNILVDICFRGNKKYRFYIHGTYSRPGIFNIMRMLNGNAREIIESYQEPGEYNISQHVRHDNFNSAVGDIRAVPSNLF